MYIQVIMGRSSDKVILREFFIRNHFRNRISYYYLLCSIKKHIISLNLFAKTERGSQRSVLLYVRERRAGGQDGAAT